MDIIKGFKGWCHKVLPLVYDDSLSYYEFLCKVLKKLNEVIEAVNQLIEGGGYDPSVITQIQEDITRLKNTVKTISEDLETLSGTVDTLEDTVGGLVDDVAAIEDVLDTKVNNTDIVFNVQNPQSTVPFENISYKGQTYVNAGSSNENVKVESFTPLVSGSAIYFSVSAGYKPMQVYLVFKNDSNQYKILELYRITDNVEQQNVNFINTDGTDATLTCNTSLGGCVLDDDFSLTYYTGIYGQAVSTKITT